MIIIKGHIPAKSNCYRITYNVRKKYYQLTKKQVLRDYEQLFSIQIPSKVKNSMISKKFALDVKVYFKTRASDLDNSFKILLDILQAEGVIKNDNLCYQINAEKFVDKNDPRIEFNLWEYKEV